ncbi:GTP cyclohydrolase-2 [Arthrobacter sp. Hiyo8]|nr:GTP cyclohydrolase-2 [Arthrobacter sp. Hiyo8]
MHDRGRHGLAAVRLRASAPRSGRAARRPGGFLLYLRQEGRGIRLYEKLDAYSLQDRGLDTYAANGALGHGEDERDYQTAAQMLLAVGVDRIRLLRNNPDKALQLEANGVAAAERVPALVHLSSSNARHLTTKRDHTGHTIDLGPLP